MTAAAAPISITAAATRRPAYVPHVGYASQSPAAPPTLADTWSAGPPFRLVLPRDKRDRLAERTAGLTRLRACSVAGCQAEGMPVLLVDSEQEAVLCPIHQLVLLDGSAVEGQPMLATAAW
jgi:hypothetical protein